MYSMRGHKKTDAREFNGLVRADAGIFACDVTAIDQPAHPLTLCHAHFPVHHECCNNHPGDPQHAR